MQITVICATVLSATVYTLPKIDNSDNVTEQSNQQITCKFQTCKAVFIGCIRCTEFPKIIKNGKKNCVIGELFVAMVGIRLQYS
jgi:hypothetical protein